MSYRVPCLLSNNRMGFHAALMLWDFICSLSNMVYTMDLGPTNPEKTWVYKKIKKGED